MGVFSAFTLAYALFSAERLATDRWCAADLFLTRCQP
jgi:hypothetical protein